MKYTKNVKNISIGPFILKGLFSMSGGREAGDWDGKGFFFHFPFSLVIVTFCHFLQI